MTHEPDTSVAALNTPSVDTHPDYPHIFDLAISDEELRVLEIIFYVVLSVTFSVAGSVANIINIIVFIKQGFHDSINISLCALAVSDLGSLLPLFWISLCFNPLFQASNIEFDYVQIQYFTAGWPHGCFVWITSWITAFITFERCVCIALPLKVPEIITHKRTLVIVIVIFITMMSIVTPVFFSQHMAHIFQNECNKTIIGIAYYKNGQHLENIIYSLNVTVQLSAVIIVTACTGSLIHNLIAKSQWRLGAPLYSSSKKTYPISVRDKKVMKMVTLIACIFVTCFLPTSIIISLMLRFLLTFNSLGPSKNSLHASWAVINTVEAINSSIPIFVYYTMSSKYRANFNELFLLRSSALTVVSGSVNV